MLSKRVLGAQLKSSRNHRREKKLWHDGKKSTSSLGCTVCPERKDCGGLNTPTPLYNCLSLCCDEPEQCDSVCRNKPRDFVQRIREISGFRLDNVPRAVRLPETQLPSVVPVLFHGKSREVPFAAPAVCLSLHSMVEHCYGKQRYADAEAVATEFRFKAGTPLLLTGIAIDQPLERWWSLGHRRRDVIRTLHKLNVKLVTTPNFSLFTDQPRWDNMYNMKRIAITHSEFLQEGLQAALHVNARTERDWERWTEYILLRDEVTHIAFEFQTGAGWAGRIRWQAAQLANLARGVGRPLHLTLRGGGMDILPDLVEAFDKTTLFETMSFMKTIHRQRGTRAEDGSLKWETSLTAPKEPVDELLMHNWALVKRSYDHVFSKFTVKHTAG